MGAPRPTVGFVLYDGCTLLDFAGATQIFTQWAAHWNPIWIAPDLMPITTSESLQVVPNFTFDSHPDVDVVFVPGGAGAGVAATMGDGRYLEWLRNVSDGQNGPWVGSVCVGAFIATAAGVFDGARVTTHWRLIDQLRALAPTFNMTVPDGFPRAVVDKEMKRFSGGGVSSSIDLALTLVRDLNDADTAAAAALIVQYAPQLPDCVPPGSPELTDPKILEAVTNDPAVVHKLVDPIAAAARKLEASV